MEGTFDVEGQSVEIMVIPQGVDIVMENFWKEKKCFWNLQTCNYKVKVFFVFVFVFSFFACF